MEYRVLIIALSFTACFFVSCSEFGEQEELVNSPEYNMLMADDNTSAIWSVNMLDVLDKSTIKELDLGMAGLIVQGLLTKLSDTAEGGVDFSNNSYFSIKHDPNYNFNYSFTYYPVVDRTKVYATLRSTIGFINAGKHGSEGLYDTFTSTSGTVAAWDDHHLVIVFSESDRKEQDLLQLATGTLDNRYVDAPEDENVRAFLKSNDDFSCYVNLGKSIKMGQEIGQLVANDDLIAAYQGGYMTGHGNFNEGEMIFSVDVNANNLKESEFNIFQEEGVSKEMVEFVATEQSINVVGANLKVEQLLKLMRNIEFEEGKLGHLLTSSGIPVENLQQLLSGEVAMSVINLKTEDTQADFDFFEEDSYSGMLDDLNIKPELIVGLGLAEGQLLADFMEEVPGINSKDGVYYIGDCFIAESQGRMILTENLDMAKKVASGSRLYEGGMVISDNEIEGPLYGYFNTNYKTYANDVVTLLNDRLTESGLGKLWMAEKISVSGNFDHFDLQIVMKDKSKNSLGTFVDSIYTALFGL
jgi:hypothetical protein